MQQFYKRTLEQEGEIWAKLTQFTVLNWRILYLVNLIPDNKQLNKLYMQKLSLLNTLSVQSKQILNNQDKDTQKIE